MEGRINQLKEVLLDQHMKWRQREQELLAENKSYQERDERRTAEESFREAEWKEIEMSWSKERKEFEKRERILKQHIAIREAVIFRLVCNTAEYHILMESDEETEEETEEKGEMEEGDGSQDKTMLQVRENIQDFSAPPPELSAADSDFEVDAQTEKPLLKYNHELQSDQGEEEGSSNPSVETSAHQQIPVPVEPQLNTMPQTDCLSDTEAPKDNGDQGYSTIVPKKDTSIEEELEGAPTQAARTQKTVRRKKKLRRMRRNKRH